ncbi:trehalose-phosphatase [Halomontanus rarus]|uniref:trehalose-phosphatase n=1 Tax=Halomontanus rarus TaxID=3034020 RepID=UPI001A99C42B
MSTLEPTHSFDEPLPEIRSGLRGASSALVCLDFDGTLAPIVEDPDAATITPENREAVADLASSPAITTAVVSGRGLADVRDRLSLPITYAGNHGLELFRAGAGETAVHPIASKRAPLVEEVCAALERALAPVPNVEIENKRLTGTVHVRSVPQPLRETVRRTTRSVVDRIGGGDLETSLGKRIVEISPSVPWGKGDAVSLLEESCLGDPFVLYLGDDVTDESAFRAIEPEGLGIHVGTERASIASCHVDSPADVTSLLEWLASHGVDELTGGVSARTPALPAASSD